MRDWQLQKHKGAFLTFSCQIWFDSSALAFTGFCAIALIFKLDIISWLRTSWPLPEMVLGLVVCQQTTEQIASSHSSPDPAGHLNVFLTLLKQIHKAKGITLLWLRYYHCSVLLGDPVHHCGLNFSQAISFGLHPAEGRKHFALLGVFAEMHNHYTGAKAGCLFSQEILGKQAIEIFLKCYLKTEMQSPCNLKL